MKLLALILGTGALLLTGCRDCVPVDTRSADHANGDLLVLRTDGTLLRFSEYVVQTDTLFGSAAILTYTGERAGTFSGGIPLRSILFSGQERINGKRIAYAAAWAIAFIVYGLLLSRPPSHRRHLPKHA